MKGLDVGYGVLCHRFDMRRAGQHQQFNWRARRSWDQKLYQAQAELLSVITALASHDKIRSKSYRMVCSTQPEESGNKDYDDHDADDVKNVHCTLRLSHARLQYESTMLQ
jgi:hypothetical protein